MRTRVERVDVVYLGLEGGRTTGHDGGRRRTCNTRQSRVRVRRSSAEERMVKVSPRPYRSLLVASALRHGQHGTAHPRCAVTYVTTIAASLDTRLLICATCEMSLNPTVVG